MIKKIENENLMRQCIREFNEKLAIYSNEIAKKIQSCIEAKDWCSFAILLAMLYYNESKAALYEIAYEKNSLEGIDERATRNVEYHIQSEKIRMQAIAAGCRMRSVVTIPLVK